MLGQPLLLFCYWLLLQCISSASFLPSFLPSSLSSLPAAIGCCTLPDIPPKVSVLKTQQPSMKTHTALAGTPSSLTCLPGCPQLALTPNHGNSPSFPLQELQLCKVLP